MDRVMGAVEAVPPGTLAWAIGWVVILGAAGVASTDLSPWYYALAKPAWKPSDVLFGPAWTTIFVCAAIAWVVAAAAPGASPAARMRILVAYAVNGALNVTWSLLFFRLRRPDWALLEVGVLWLSIVAMAAAVGALAPAAALLLLPYLGWVAFAGALNRWIVRVNGPFGGTR